MSSPVSARSPEHAPPAASNPVVRRSFTVPTKRSTQPRTSPQSTASADGIETLFTHGATKIVSFTAASLGGQALRSQDRVGDAPVTIPWTSPTERTLAVGVYISLTGGVAPAD
jgi:hypothetical protein